MDKELKQFLADLTQLVVDLAESAADVLEHTTHNLRPGQAVREVRAKAASVRERSNALRELSKKVLGETRSQS